MSNPIINNPDVFKELPTDENSKGVAQKLKGWAKELTIFAVIFFGIMAWQTKDMLNTDGSVSVDATVLPTLVGTTMPLAESGKPTLVYFFAPWCSICKLSIGNLEGLNTDKFNIVTVALDYDSIEAVQGFAQEQGLTVPVLLGTRDLKEKFKIKGYPSYYLLDENKKVVSKSYGYSSTLGMKLRAWANS
jgi:thiol-disulfide isomerase/thioredoxin